LRAALMGGERSPEASAWYTRAGHGDSHPPAPVFLCWFQFPMLYFGHLCFSGFFCCISSLYSLFWLLMVLGTFGFLIHHLPPSLVAPFLPFVPRTNRPASLETLPPCTFVLSVFFLLFQVAQP